MVNSNASSHADSLRSGADAQPAVGIHMTGIMAPRSGWATPRACAVAKTFDVLSTKTAYVLMREAFYGATRFEEFVERACVSEPIAASRLRELVADGIMVKVPYREPGQRTRSEYHLTEKGTDFLPVLAAMMSWGNKWLFPDGARAVLSHHDCGEQIDVVMKCRAGHEVNSGELDLTRLPRGQAPIREA